jgi:hypothetical protein
MNKDNPKEGTNGRTKHEWSSGNRGNTEGVLGGVGFVEVFKPPNPGIGGIAGLSHSSIGGAY